MADDLPFFLNIKKERFISNLLPTDFFSSSWKDIYYFNDSIPVKLTKGLPN